jgi:threonine aldolase
LGEGPGIQRREFLIGGTLPALAAPVASASGAEGTSASAAAAVPAGSDLNVQFRADGLDLPPSAYAALLADIAASRGIEADEYSRDGVVAELETRMAALLGKETAVFLPTGTLANHIAVRLLTGGARGGDRGRRVLVQKESHLYNDSGDCAETLSGLALVPLAPDKTMFTRTDVQAEVQRAEGGRVATSAGAISIESPVRRRMGEVADLAEIERIAAFARERRIGLHLDGARLFIASAYNGIAPADYAAPFDTVYVSLYKNFSAASGAILAGSRALLDGLFHERRMFGGGLNQVWPFAAVALHYLDGFDARYRQAVATADALFRALGDHPRCWVERRPNGTNVARLHVQGADTSSLPDRLRAAGIAIWPARRVTADGAEFTLTTNESLLRRPPEILIRQFLAALG